MDALASILRDELHDGSVTLTRVDNAILQSDNLTARSSMKPISDPSLEALYGPIMKNL